MYLQPLLHLNTYNTSLHLFHASLDPALLHSLANNTNFHLHIANLLTSSHCCQTDTNIHLFLPNHFVYNFHQNDNISTDFHILSSYLLFYLVPTFRLHQHNILLSMYLQPLHRFRLNNNLLSIHLLPSYHLR